MPDSDAGDDGILPEVARNTPSNAPNLVEKLREASTRGVRIATSYQTGRSSYMQLSFAGPAADEIERLRAHVATLKRDSLEWQPIETAPRDGRKIDLMFPHPRGRTIDCFWRIEPNASHPEGGWFWRSPKWDKTNLLPESEWPLSCYPSMQPTHWRWPPPHPTT